MVDTRKRNKIRARIVIMKSPPAYMKRQEKGFVWKNI
jgi:hypothetical protein